MPNEARGATIQAQPVAFTGTGTEVSLPYSSLTVEDRGDLNPPKWRWSWLGRILVLNVGGCVVYIGPHWYCCIIMLLFILGVGTFHCSAAMSPGGDPKSTIGGIVVTTLSTVTFLRCALSNPGVLRAGAESILEEGHDGEQAASRTQGAVPDSTPLQGLPDRRFGAHCSKCNILQPKGCSHCDFCQVCIEGFDHHCPWMGKCIGKNNLCAFYTFILVGISSLAYVFLVALTQVVPVSQQVTLLTSAPTAASSADAGGG